MSMSDGEIRIRPVKEEDLYELWEFGYKEESPEWKRWDAPYYPLERITYEQMLEKKDRYIDRDHYWLIEINDRTVGIVSWYWEHEPSLWLEMGIVIYDPVYWSGGYGTRVLRMWTRRLFETMPLVRVGFTTWSGNARMMKVGEKLGMTLEARLRKCRYYDGQYYDSIRMGILREEWVAHEEYEANRAQASALT
ncbi:GNAT family N-acetyltransferase [Paenibacillus marinisediminis]